MRVQHRRRWIVAAVIALLAYPVIGTLFLWTGLFERLVRSDSLVIDLGNPAWTLWPGHVHARSARILVNGETQFDLRAKDLLVHLNLFQLAKKHVHVTSVSADDVRYAMRVQVQSTKGIEERLAAYPKLEALPGNAQLVRQKKPEEEKKKGKAFTVEVDGIDARVSELWFMEYHYVGPGTLKGSFLVGPRRLRIGTTVQHLGPGEVRFGQVTLAKNLAGRFEAGIPELDPTEHAGAQILETLTANIDMKADVLTLAPVSAYVKGLKLRGGAGPLELRTHLSKGRLSDDSHFSFSTPDVAVQGKGFGVASDLDVDASVETADRDEAKGTGSPKDHEVLPRLRATSKTTYVSLTDRRGDAFTVQLRNHEQRAVLQSTQLGRMTDLEHARIRFPEIVSHDLGDLAAVTSNDPAARSRGGDARASLDLDVDAHHVARGALKAKFNGLHVATQGLEFRGNGDAACRIHADLDAKATRLDDVTIRVLDLQMHAGDENVHGWWTIARMPSFSAWGLPPKKIETRATVLAKSAEPMLKALAAKDEIADIIPALTNLNDLRIRATVIKDKGVTDVMMNPVETDLVDVAGRFRAQGDDKRMAIVVGGKAVSVGIAKDASGTSVKPFAREGWLNTKLRSFPKPPERVRTSQP